MWLINRINSVHLAKLIQAACILHALASNLVLCERVRVKIYDHRAQHDPVERYGAGVPWNYYG